MTSACCSTFSGGLALKGLGGLSSTPAARAASTRPRSHRMPGESGCPAGCASAPYGVSPSKSAQCRAGTADQVAHMRGGLGRADAAFLKRFPGGLKFGAQDRPGDQLVPVDLVERGRLQRPPALYKVVQECRDCSSFCRSSLLKLKLLCRYRDV